MRLSSARIAWWICLGCIIGCGAFVYNTKFIYISLCCLFIIFVGVSLCIFGTRTVGICAICCGVCICAGYAYAYMWSHKTYLPVPHGEEILIQGIIGSYPRISDFGTGFIIKTTYGNIQVYTCSFQKVEYGDRVFIRGIPEVVEASEGYLLKDSVRALVRNGSVEMHSSGNISVTRILYRVRAHIRDTFIKILPYDEASLATGLLIGGGSISFSPQFKESMKNSGTTHLVALSGYNISIIVVCAYTLFGLGLNRRATFWATIVCTALFVCMTGAEASIVRAAIMGGLVIIAQHTGRVYACAQSIILVAWIMVLHNPMIIRYDSGCILSFVALLGITYITPILKRPFEEKSWSNGKFFKMITETIGAQIAVSPLLMGLFESVSYAGVIANICILLSIPYTMAASFLVGVCSMCIPPLGTMVAFIIKPFLSYGVMVIELFGSIPRAHIQSSPLLVIALYAICVGALFYVRKKWGTHIYA